MDSDICYSEYIKYLNRKSDEIRLRILKSNKELSQINNRIQLFGNVDNKACSNNGPQRKLSEILKYQSDLNEINAKKLKSPENNDDYLSWKNDQILKSNEFKEKRTIEREERRKFFKSIYEDYNRIFECYESNPIDNADRLFAEAETIFIMANQHNNRDRYNNNQEPWHKNKNNNNNRNKNNNPDDNTPIINDFLLIKYDIRNRSQWLQWLKLNHPDKGGTDIELCGKIIEAGKNTGW